MFDNLRDDSSFYEDEQNDAYQAPTAQAQAQPTVAAPRSKPPKRSARYMGMTAQQRFLLSVMLLITVCVIGMVALVVSGTIGF
jgi:hypothetical protein